MSVPHIGTQAWINLLNLTVDESWRTWSLDGQTKGSVSKLPPIHPLIYSLIQIWDYLKSLRFFLILRNQFSWQLKFCLIQIHQEVNKWLHHLDFCYCKGKYIWSHSVHRWCDTETGPYQFIHMIWSYNDFCVECVYREQATLLQSTSQRKLLAWLVDGWLTILSNYDEL